MMKPAHINGQHRGFTILEVLVSSAILAMIATIVFGTFFYTVNNAEQLEDKAAMYQRANYILGSISKSVASAYAPYAGEISDDESERPPVFEGGPDLLGDTQTGSLSTYTTEPIFTGEKAGAEIAYVSYEVVDASEAEGAPGWVEDANNPLVLTCKVEPLLAISDDAGDSSSSDYPLWLLNVRSVHFSFLDGTDWVEEWNFEDQGAFPDAVKVELELADSAGVSHSFSTVADVHANAVLEEQAEAALEGTTEEEGEQEEGTEESSGEGEETAGGEKTGTNQQENPFTSEGNENNEIFPQNSGSFPFGFD